MPALAVGLLASTAACSDADVERMGTSGQDAGTTPGIKAAAEASAAEEEEAGRTARPPCSTLAAAAQEVGKVICQEGTSAAGHNPLESADRASRAADKAQAVP